MEKSTDIVLRMIDIRSWKTPVVDQFNLEGVPHFLVYDKKGKLVKSGFEVHRFLSQWNRKTEAQKKEFLTKS